MFLLLALPPHHPFLLPHLQVLPGVGHVLDIELREAVLGYGGVDLGEGLVGALLGSPLVATEVSPPGASVGELLPIVLVVLVAPGDDDGLAAFPLSARVQTTSFLLSLSTIPFRYLCLGSSML